jgi:hypothetical protein
LPITPEQCAGLGVALNEAELLGLEVDPVRRLGAATFRVLTLPLEGPTPEDRRVQFIFQPVGRVVASLRNSSWDDPVAAAVPFDVVGLLPIVQSFGGLPIYGWTFFDVHERELQKWGKRLSLDWASGPGGMAHSLCLFQDPPDRVLDVCIWFDELQIRDAKRLPIVIDDFIASGMRWWDALHSGDARAQGFGIQPLK